MYNKLAFKNTVITINIVKSSTFPKLYFLSTIKYYEIRNR